jgi:hypothetical protein
MSPGGTAENGAKISTQISFAPPGLDLFSECKPTADAVGYYRTLLRS